MKTMADFINALRNTNGTVSIEDSIATFEDGTTFTIPDSSAPWGDDAIQFPRLIAEISATQDLDMPMLAESMDCTVEEVGELFNRADAEWESIKARTF